jgi:putative transposase
MIELPNSEKRIEQTGKQVGIDVGLKTLAALSTGELIENPRWLRESLAKLRKLQLMLLVKSKEVIDRRKLIARSLDCMKKFLINVQITCTKSVINW